MKTLIFKSYNKNALNFYMEYVKVLLIKKEYNYSFFNKIVNTNKITILKSPHVHKKFKEHYVQKEYSVVLKLCENDKKILSLLSVLHLNKNSISLTIS